MVQYACGRVRVDFVRTLCFCFPTPFFNLAWDNFCLPDMIVTSTEYAIGAVVFASGAANALADAIRTIVSQIQDFADNQLGLFEVGREVHQKRLALRQKGNANGTGATATRGTASNEQCGHQDNWSVDLTLKLVLSANIPGKTYWFKFGTGISLGCKSGQLVAPNWIFTIDLGAGIALPLGDPSAGVAPEFGLSFNDNFPTFSNRVAYGCKLWMKPQAGFSIGAAKIVAASPITFGICPPEVPNSFSFAVQVKPSAGLAQISASARAAADAESDSGSGVLGSLTAASQRLASSDLRRALLETALTKEDVSVASDYAAQRQEERSRNNHDVQAATEENEELEKHGGDHHGGLMEAVTAKSAERSSIDVGFSVSAGASFKFCITPLGCNGQD